MGFGDIIRESVRDTEGNRYGDVDMGEWTIYAQRFSAPIREGFHYFGSFQGETYVGPCNTAEDVWTEILAIRAEIRPGHTPLWHRESPAIDHSDCAECANEYERASIIALARRLDAATLDAEACAAGPGCYEGANDLALVVALDIIVGHGAMDEQAGSTEYGLHLARFGRYVLATDDRGFVSAYRCDTAELAQADLDAEDARQSEGTEED